MGLEEEVGVGSESIWWSFVRRRLEWGRFRTLWFCGGWVGVVGGFVGVEGVWLLGEWYD